MTNRSLYIGVLSMKDQSSTIPFAVKFGSAPLATESFKDAEGNLIVEMSNPTHIGDEGDEAC